MIIDLLGIIVIIIFTIYVFKTANENGRHGVGWAAACLFTGLFLQWVLLMIVLVVIGVAMVLVGSQPGGIAETLGWWLLGLRVAFIALSVAAMFQILKKVSELPEENEQYVEPPPPPTFEREVS